MKPVIVNTYRNTGGAAKAVGRIYSAISQQSPEAQHLTFQDNISQSGNNPFFGIYPYLDFGFGFLQTYRRMPFFPAVIPSYHLKNQIKKISPDIIHFNWMQGGYFNFNNNIIPEDIPLVWTFHDLWPITGGCPHPGKCDHYLFNCGNCPLFKFPHKKDISHRTLERKKNFFQTFPEINIVAPSHWLKNVIEKSPLSKKHKITVIHNGIDTKSVFVHEKQEARQKSGLTTNKSIILFGAIGATTNRGKGFDLLVEALKNFDKEKIKLVVFGADTKPHIPELDITYYPLIKDFKKLNLLYSAAEVMVVPSREEVFGQTVIEAMAAGTPVVSFENTGPADIISHCETGFLAKQFDTLSLAEGIDWVLKNNPAQLGQIARTETENKFDITITASKYIHLYKAIE